ncbi:MAG: class I fructose-bisphosphate aldolase [Pseudomonadota bacterium]
MNQTADQNITNQILSNYHHVNPGVMAKLRLILNHGKLGGTGKMVIYPVDQGFEHGPARSFAVNPDSYDPLYHWQLAVDSGVNAFAAPLGVIAAGARTFAGQIPTILKINSGNSLHPKSQAPTQAITSTVDQALELGCSAIGFTIYPGSASNYQLIEHFTELSNHAKSCGLAVVLWAYARGEDLAKDDETALDIIAYNAHMAALLGADIIKVKLPTNELSNGAAAKVYQQHQLTNNNLDARVSHIKQCCFNGKRLVVFSGGGAKDTTSLLNEIKAINTGGGDGSIIGRNVFQRPRDEALALLDEIINIYRKVFKSFH